MAEMNKFEIIRDYVLENRERFSLATDIYDNFHNIKLHLADAIYSTLEKELKSLIPVAETRPYGLYANNQYLDAIYSDRLKVQVEFWNFFKSPCLKVSQVNSDESEVLIQKIDDCLSQSDDVVRINLSKYNFNKVSNTLELYDLYKNQNLKQELIENFKTHVLVPIKSVFDIFDDFEKH
jgi:hypothetical protein